MSTNTDTNEIDWHDGSKPKKKPVDVLVLAKYTTFGYYVIAPLLIGVFFGLRIDKAFDTKPLYTIIFLFFGTIATFYNLYLLVKRID